MITFSVSDVEHSRERLPSAAASAALALQVRRPIEAGGLSAPDLVTLPTGTHFYPAPQNVFVHAVHEAFNDHRPLILSPDDVWLCLAQGFARHVNENAEALRSRLVQHEGPVTLVVRRDEFVVGSPENDWPGCFAEFSDQIAEHLGERRKLVVADFSTTGPVQRAASEIVLMNMVQRYFRYEVATMCGIPEITLLGTPEDYQSIRHRVEAFEEFDLGWWTEALIPILDQLVAASQGQVDRAFWRSFYKPNTSSEGPYATGWINTFFPYLNAHSVLNRPDPHPLRRNVHMKDWRDSKRDRRRGPMPGDFPVGLSMAPFVWNYLRKEVRMELFGGFCGVSQDADSLALRPVIGWAVCKAVAGE